MYASAMSIIVIAFGPNHSDDSVERIQPSMLIEVILSGGSIHASSSPELEHFERNTIGQLFVLKLKIVPDATGIYCHHFDEKCAIVFLYSLVVYLCCKPETS